MAIVFKTPKSALNTTTKTIQNLANDCPPCPEVNLEAAELEYTQNGEYTVTPEQGVDGFSSIDVTVNIPSDVNNQNKTVDPSTSSQSVSADSGYSGLGTVTVNAVTSAIDQNIAAGNIKKDVTILGVTGSYDPQPTLSNLNITPSTNAQEYNPAISGVDGYSLVRVNAVTAAIDSNIQAENILSGITILGVEGTDAGYNTGYSEGESAGQAAGYESGYSEGEAAGHSAGYTEGEAAGYQNGYDAGYADGEASCPPPTLGSLSVTPSTSAQSFDPADEGYDGFDSVSVSAVTSAIDNNIAAGNIKNGVTILGVTGSYDPQPELQAKTVNPSTSQQTVSPDQGKDGLSSVTVNAVTNAIDANIQAGNIKNGVSILGVTGNLVEASLWSEEFLGDVTGVYTLTPQGKWNGFDEVQITVQSNPIGSFWDPFVVNDYTKMADVYNKLDEGGYFDDILAFFSMEVESGSIDSKTGYYIAEDADGNSFAIEPYFENPDYDPSLTPEDQPDVPQLIFPENFDLSGLSVQVEASFNDVTITENEPEDPMSEPTYTTEIALSTLNGINWNSDMESWPLYWNGTLSGGIETSTRNLHLSTNEPQVMSLSSSEPWEIELDQPQAQSQMNIRPLAKSGLRSAAPTLEIDQMEGDAGVFTLNVLSTSDQNTGFTVRGLNSGNEVYVEVNSMGNYFTIESLEDDNEITISYNTSSQSDTDSNPFDIEYSVDGGDTWETPTWSSLTGASDFTVELEATGDTIMFKGNNDALYLSKPNSQSCYLRFASTKTVDIYGNICSMLSKTDFNNYILETSSAFFNLFYGGNLKIVNAENLIMPSVLSTRCFGYMFRDCTLLESAPALPAGSIPQEAYQGMFQGCTSLVTAPELPAKILGTYCYSGMFYNCSSLENVPVINVKELKTMCFNTMFYGCTSITSIPDGSMYGASGRTAANNSCSMMFNGCTSLEYVPSDLLQSSYAGTDCYSGMFQNCTNLTTAPYLPALVDGTVSSTRAYRYMFKNCTSLTASPVIASPSGYLSSFEEMFAGCTSLEEVTCLVKTSGGSFTNFLSGASETGTLYKDPESSVDWTLVVPTGWTIEDYVEPSN